jgi:peptide/nickel transport system substrate-binding protein
MNRRLLFAALLALAACKDKKPAQPAPGPAAAVTPTLAWLKGELPPEVTQGTPASGGTFTLRVPTEPLGLNRLHDQQVEGMMVRYTVGPLYESLAELDRDTHPKYALKPLLAESWDESADHLTFTIKLRRGVKFHNGDKLTSKDVKATFDAILLPANLTNSMRSNFLDVTVTAPDEHTVVVTTKKAHFMFRNNMLVAVPILPASALKGDFNTLAINRAPIGTGPFRFVSWETGKSITYARNDEYWGPKAFVDKVVIRFVKDETVATQLWERGEFDLMTRIQPSVWRSIEAPTAANAWAITGYHRINFVENYYSWIGWNEERPFFADQRVRRALAMLYPGDKVAKNIDMDLELPTTCPYYRPSESCDPAVKPIAYDPASAIALLRTAGWEDHNGDGVLDKDGKPFKFTFLANPHSVKLSKLAPLLQEEFKKVGIEMDVEKVDAAQYVARLRAHDFDAASLGWNNNDINSDQFQVYHSTQKTGGSNFVSYDSKAADALIDQIRLTFDEHERHGLERKLHAVIYEEQPYTFLTNRPALDAIKTHVRGIHPSLPWYDLRKVWLAPPNSPKPAPVQ